MNMSTMKHWGIMIAFAVVCYLVWTGFISKFA